MLHPWNGVFCARELSSRLSSRAGAMRVAVRQPGKLQTATLFHPGATMMLLPNDPPHRSVRFELMADAQPGLLPRALAPFARRDLTPDLLRVRRDGTTMLVEIALNTMPSDMLSTVEGNLRQIVGLHRLSITLQAQN